MENKKGFTLVEMLAVLVILGTILVLVVPMILNTRESALNKLSKEQIRSLKNAGEMLAIDLDENTSDIYNCKNNSWIKKLNVCKMENGYWTKINSIKIDDLKKHAYFEDNANHCSGSITITKVSDDYNVDTSKANCSK